jgi:hypothetical protein
MNEPQFNPDDLPPFEIPDSFLEKLLEFTRNYESNTSGGFIIAYVNQVGGPVVLTKADTQITEMGLRKALEQYLEDAKEQEIIDFGGDELS